MAIAVRYHPALPMSTLPDAYHTLAAPSTGEYKDRNSKFIAYAYPVQTKAAALTQLEALRKEHFKARHHCFAWRLGLDRGTPPRQRRRRTQRHCRWADCRTN